ncbi:hypothetical protein HYY73_02030 [Candidatus Woesearchaeota archaeon]|nr:hypothetical protein [Candidatus Woesearchaeota archaeon]
MTSEPKKSGILKLWYSKPGLCSTASIKLSSEELKTLKAIATNKGMGLSTFLREHLRREFFELIKNEK